MKLDLTDARDLSACEYWLLNSTVTKPVSTGFILRDPYNGMDIPPFVYIFTEEEIISSLIKLFKTGYLLAFKNPREETYIPTGKEIKTAFLPGVGSDAFFWFILTGKGGEKWESLSSPNWDIYTQLSDGFETEIPSIYQAGILGTGKTWVEKRFNSFCITRDHEYLYPKIISQEVLEISPYKPFYWKILDRGYWIDFKYELVEKSLIRQQVFDSCKRNAVDIPDESSKTFENYWYKHPYGEFHFQAKQKLRNQGYDI
jgi:hypothetical protein